LDEGTWKPYSERDCTALESKWEQLPDSIKHKEQGVPDEKGVVDELALTQIPGPEIGEKKGEAEVDDVSQDDMKVIVGVEQLHHVDLLSLRYILWTNRG
jgi:hypothetical protein